jgi:hypothetical protein
MATGTLRGGLLCTRLAAIIMSSGTINAFGARMADLWNDGGECTATKNTRSKLTMHEVDTFCFAAVAQLLLQ